MSYTYRAARAALLLAAAAFAAPNLAQACACGCGVFDIGDGTMIATDSPSGFTAWFRFATMDQNQNWEFGSRAPASDNADKAIKTDFYIFGGQYVINHKWTLMAELPIYDRALTTTDDGTVLGPPGSINTRHIADLGDLQLTAMYTGLASDMSTGLSFGLKLPTGNSTGPNGPLGGPEFDRDSLPGTGSTDLVFGGYHVGKITADEKLSYFAQARYQAAVATRDGYRPGNEFDAALGVGYNLGGFGKVSKIVPVLQLINSYRAHDTGINADPLNSGYERLLISPGVEVRLQRFAIYADVALPIYQHTNAAPNPAVEGTAGQLVASSLFKVQVTYGF